VIASSATVDEKNGFNIGSALVLADEILMGSTLREGIPAINLLNNCVAIITFYYERR
jgi:hypothetical protein